MTPPTARPLHVGFLAIGRRRPGFDPEWGSQMAAAAWEAARAGDFQAVRPAEAVVDDATLRRAIAELRQADCRTLVVLQPTMGDGRLAPVLAQLWAGPLVLWATPERPDADRVTACSLVAAHVFGSTLRQMQRPFELVYGPPDDPATRRRLDAAVRLTAAAAGLARAKVGLVGQHAPGFVNMHADPAALSRSLGAQLHHFGLAEFVARVEACEPARVDADVQAVLDMDLPAGEPEKGTGTFCRNGPSGASHKRCLSPFPRTPA